MNQQVAEHSSLPRSWDVNGRREGGLWSQYLRQGRTLHHQKAPNAPSTLRVTLRVLDEFPAPCYNVYCLETVGAPAHGLEPSKLSPDKWASFWVFCYSNRRLTGTVSMALGLHGRP